MSEIKSQYALYPGCSMLSTARPYDMSIRRVLPELGLPLQDVEDWNCCGATEYFTVNRLPAYGLVARNLALAADQGATELVAPCSACYLNLRKTDHNMGKYAKVDRQVNQALAAGGLNYTAGSLRVRHLLDVVVDDVGYDAIKKKVTQLLKGLKVAPYYGCLIARPYGERSTEYPTHLDELMETLGARVVDYPLKTHCCGGHMTQISEETAYELIRRLLQNAAEYEADVIVTICPMCQLNLDAFQSNVNRMFGTDFHIPILYFTQMLGLAFGAGAKELGIGRGFVSADDALRKIGQEEEKPRKPARRDKDALPMPSR